MQMPGLNFDLGEDIDALREGVDGIAQRVDVLAEFEVQSRHLHGGLLI